jgi:hypothetical protein
LCASIAKVTARVTRVVICGFHAPVTIPALQMAIAALEISHAPRQEEASKMKKRNNNLTRLTYKESSRTASAQEFIGVLYLPGNIQSGKSKKERTWGLFRWFVFR